MNFDFGRCIWNPLIINLTASIIAPGMWLIQVAGILFNWLVYNTVVNFYATYHPFQMAVETAWSAFRDLANILIIGIFTFIAISIILGLKEFGQKKLIARVLIVAILINFSLLFAQMIVDAGNYLAYAIYCTSDIGGNGCGSTAGTSGDVSQTQVTAAGISGQFLHLMGTPSFAASQDVAQTIMTKGAWWQALVYALFALAILVSVSLVLLYGSFLLVSRAILILLLFVTAAIAFASHLIPTWDKSNYGWHTWWSTLIKSAALAPVLMFFLWVTLSMSYGLANSGQNTGGTLAALAVNPVSSANIQLLFDCIIILGLLFAAFKLSSMFSTKIAGISLAPTALSLAGLAPLALGSRFLAAPLGRQILGRGAARREEKLNDQLQRERLELSALSPNSALYNKQARKVANLARQAVRAAGRADARYNPADTALMQGVAKAAGLSGFLSGASPKGAKGFAGQIKERAENASKVAEKAAKVSPDEIKAVRENATNNRREDIAREKQRVQEEVKGRDKQTSELKEALRGAKTEQEKIRDSLEHDEKDRKQMVDQVVQASKTMDGIKDREDIKNANQAVDEAQTRLDEIKKERDEALIGINPEDRDRVEQQLRSRGATESEMRHQADKIEQARQEIVHGMSDAEIAAIAKNISKARITDLDSSITQKRDQLNVMTERVSARTSEVSASEEILADMRKNLTKLESTESKEVANAANKAEANYRAAGIAAGQRAILSHSDPIQKMTDVFTGDDKAVAKVFTKSFKTKQGDQARVAEMLKNITSQNQGGAH